MPSKTAAIVLGASGSVGLALTGANTANITLAEHRAVDVDLNAAFARRLKASGKVKHMALMTALGADPTAKETGSGAAGRARYNRVKGEAEQAVRAVAASGHYVRSHRRRGRPMIWSVAYERGKPWTALVQSLVLYNEDASWRFAIYNEAGIVDGRLEDLSADAAVEEASGSCCGA